MTQAEIRKRYLDDFHKADSVFTGRAIAVNQGRTTFEVKWYWKGSSARTVTLGTGQPEGWSNSESFNFERGLEYLVWAYKGYRGELTTNSCTRTALLENAGYDIRDLDEIVRHKIMK